MSLTSTLETLAHYRAHNTRASKDIVEKGHVVLKGSGLRKLGDDSWQFLEQYALAAIDVGDFDSADDALQRLTDQFPGSPRVDVLVGIRMEATEPNDTVLKYYDELMTEDPANAAVWKRRISMKRRLGRVEQAVQDLSEYLDTFYNDVEGWLELADIYSACNQYTQSLQSLSHVLLLAPQNPFYMLRFAETAYTANDLQLALKTALVVIDMAERDVTSSTETPATGISIRAWWCIKLCSRKLLAQPNLSSASGTTAPKSLRLIDELATERMMTTYSVTDKQIAQGRDEVVGWMSATP
ncbi:TPR-like protein [Cylindrobasidium torrendii FP15055 ss-10]|uniref:ER membrane protein complex subunit 2 n=1 Tax=Cylindrobasidium torrendii FP15055 ss-10 TaxID=1314674 RepID=A0A0D7BD89_9AGAR|nr:TPR-like protein [Cylindrobasidium torrendii FP15055 ss-10]